ncbi:MAG TPA: DUF2341 domain-containing protein [Kofleriaceae bacterium]
MRAILVLLLATAGCRATGVFTCETSDQCRLGSVTGFCESTGYCSFLDTDCASAHRYHDSAGELAEQCVDGVRARKKTITIAGSNVAAAVMDFPVWIDVTDAQVAMRAAPDGSDLEFTAADGSPIPYEIQRWNAATGRLLAWVRLPSLQPGTDTVVVIRYGAPRVTAPAPAMVFANAFLAVWHFDDSLQTPQIAEATGARAGTASPSLDASRRVAAALGDGIDFGRSGTTDMVQFSNPLTGNSSHTISVWLDERTPLTLSYASIMTVGSPVTNESRWFHAHFLTANVAVGFYGNDWVDTGTTVTTAGWTLLHWVFDSSSRTSLVYRNGSMVGSHQHDPGISTDGTGGQIGNAPVEWGVNNSNRVPFNGVLDEVRIASAIRSAGWIATEYANQSSPSTFYSVGAEQLVE